LISVKVKEDTVDFGIILIILVVQQFFSKKINLVNIVSTVLSILNNLKIIFWYTTTLKIVKLFLARK